MFVVVLNMRAVLLSSFFMATPRFQTILDDTLPSWAGEIEAKAEEFGTPLLDWQRKAAAYVGALREDGQTPRYSAVILTVPRQSGKTTLAKAVLAARAERAANQRMYAFAQGRTYAVRHLEDLAFSAGEYVKYNRGMGAERLFWPNGTTLEPQASNAKAAHGFSVDFALLDEVWAIEPEVMGGILPATAAKPYHQLLYISTMGTHESVTWNDLVAQGRESIENPDSPIAYLEYSAASDDEVFDEEKWFEFMPALGAMQSLEGIRAIQASLPPYEFIRAFGNRLTATSTSIFPAEWYENAWHVIQPPDKFVLAVDVNDEPAGASLTTAHLVNTRSQSENGRSRGVTDANEVAVRVIDWRFGTPTWVPAKLREVLSRRTVGAVVADLGGPTRQVAAEIKAICEEKRIPFVDRQPKEVAGDTLAFYDALREERVLLEKSTQLEEAFQGAYKKPYRDMWLVTRTRMVVDASPLISTILAYGLAVELNVKPVAKPAIH